MEELQFELWFTINLKAPTMIYKGRQRSKAGIFVIKAKRNQRKRVNVIETRLCPKTAWYSARHLAAWYSAPPPIGEKNHFRTIVRKEVAKIRRAISSSFRKEKAAKRKSSKKFQKKKMSHLEAIRSFVSLFMNKKERSQKYAGEFKPLRAICSRWQVKKSHQNFSDFQTFVIHH